MKVEFTYRNEVDLEKALCSITNNDLKIERISNKTLSVIYPNDREMFDIFAIFQKYGLVEDFIQHYLVIIHHHGGNDVLAYYIQRLNEKKLNCIVKNSHSIVIDNSDAKLNNDDLYALVEAICLNNFILIPYDYEAETYIEVKYNFSNLYNSGILTDIEFHLKDKIFKAHKAVIMGTSDYFYSSIQHCQNVDIIELDDIESDLFENVLQLIYGIKVKIEGIKTLELIKLIQYFQIKGIDIDEIVRQIKIDKDSDRYIKLLSEIYPYKF